MAVAEFQSRLVSPARGRRSASQARADAAFAESAAACASTAAVLQRRASSYACAAACTAAAISARWRAEKSASISAPLLEIIANVRRRPFSPASAAMPTIRGAQWRETGRPRPNLQRQCLPPLLSQVRLPQPRLCLQLLMVIVCSGGGTSPAC